MMTRTLVLLVGLLLSVDVTHGGDKPPEVITEKITAEELAQAFAKNAAAAKKKYLANPDDVKKGKITGVPLLQPITGLVVGSPGKTEVTLQTGNQFKVVLRSKKEIKDIQAAKKAASGSGFVVGFDGKTVTVACDEVTLTPVVGKER